MKESFETQGELPYPLKVLYVEDDAETRELTRFFLEEYFVEISVAPDGEKALELFFRQPDYDLLITDLALPGFDGFEMVRRMRRRKEELAVVVFSAHAETDLMLQAIELNVDGYLLKPFDPDRFGRTIVSSVERLLERREKIEYVRKLEERIRELEKKKGQ